MACPLAPRAAALAPDYAQPEPYPWSVLVLSASLAGALALALIAWRRLATATTVLACWRQVFDEANWGVAIADADGRHFAQVNHAFAHVFGYAAEQLRGHPIDVLLPEGERPVFAAAREATRRRGRHRYAGALRHRDGHLVAVAIDMSLASPRDGQLAYLLCAEMERARADNCRKRLAVATDFFWKIFAATPVGMVMVDAGGRYTRVNRAMCEFTGYAEDELVGRSYREITHPEDTQQHDWLADVTVDPHSPAFQIEKRYVRKDGSVAWAMLVALPFFDDAAGHSPYWVGQVLDIDRIKRVEQALRVTEQRFRGVFEHANTGMAVVARDGYIAHCNDAFRSLLGYDAEALSGMRLDDFCVDEEGGAPGICAQVLAAGGDRCRIEKRWRASDGRRLWVDLYVSAIRDEQGRVGSLVAVVGDITESKRSALALADSRRKLRALAAHQEALLEQERKHIAREVHDELGQLLTALKMDISLMRLRFGGDAALLAMIDAMRALVERTIVVVRQVASNLRPAVLDHGLLPAIEWLADDFFQRAAISCRIETRGGEIDLPELQATAVFRVVQESLTNVARHSRASAVLISLQRGDGLLDVVIEDDGCGFDTVAVGKMHRFGLFGMRERIRGLGGTLRVRSNIGKGTAVSFRLPLANGEPS